MSMHQCPKCDLRFTWSTELDDHCRTDHPAFHHDYPVRGVRHNDAVAAAAAVEDAVAVAAAVDAEAADEAVEGLPVRPANSASILATYWNER